MTTRHTRVLVVDREHPDPAAIAAAAACLRAGGLVALPTETVYGLGADALNPLAVAAIFAAKGRPSTDPLIVHIGSLEQLDTVARDIPPLARRLGARFWPGPLTLILPKRASVPDAVTAGFPTVAVRVPAHPVAQAVIAAVGVPIAAPSANQFSRPSPTRAAHVLSDLDGRVDLVLDAGPTEVGVESTVLDLTVEPPLIRRPGGITLESLHAVMPDVRTVDVHESGQGPQVSPGQLLRHYAPQARLTLIEGECEAVRRYVAAEVRARRRAGGRMGVLAPQEDVTALGADLAGDDDVTLQAYGTRHDPAACARDLFVALRALDRPDIDEILAMAPPPTGLGLAIHDRLTRAAEGRVVRVDGAGSAEGTPNAPDPRLAR